MNQIRIAMRAIAFEYNVGECYSHTGDSNRATSFWCSSHSNRGRWIRCTTWRCRFDSLPMRIVCSECNANTAMSFWCECKLNSAMNIAIHIAVAEWDVHVNWIRWIATYRDSTVFTVFTIFSFDANLIHCLVTWAARLTSACDAVWPWLLCVDFLFVVQKCYQLQSFHAQSNLSWSCLGCPTIQRPKPSLLFFA